MIFQAATDPLFSVGTVRGLTDGYGVPGRMNSKIGQCRNPGICQITKVIVLMSVAKHYSQLAAFDGQSFRKWGSDVLWLVSYI